MRAGSKPHLSLIQVIQDHRCLSSNFRVLCDIENEVFLFNLEPGDRAAQPWLLEHVLEPVIARVLVDEARILVGERSANSPIVGLGSALSGSLAGFRKFKPEP